MTNNELKPCPFPHIEGAGQYMSIREDEYTRGIYPFYAHCLICGAKGPVAKTAKEAIAAWNMRADNGNEHKCEDCHVSPDDCDPLDCERVRREL